MACKKAKTKLIKGIPYYYEIVEGNRNLDGTRSRKYIYAKTVKELETKVKEFKRNLDDGLKIDNKEVFQGLFKSWLFNTHLLDKKPSTIERYEGLYRNYILNSSLGKSKIKNLNSLVIQEYYNNLYKGGRSVSTLKMLHKVIKPFLLFLYNNGYTKKDFGSKGLIKIPTEKINNEEELQVLTLEEQKIFLNSLEGNKDKLIFMTALMTGLRLGELLNLKWSNVDLKEYTLKVDKTIKRVKNIETGKTELIEQEPKTKKSKRVVPIPLSLVKDLKELKKEQNKTKLLIGELYKNNDLVFATDFGNYLDSNNINKRFKKALIKANLEPKKFHSLRHTYATRLFENDVPLKTVSELLGHSNIQITANTYITVLEDEKKKVINQLDNIFAL